MEKVFAFILSVIGVEVQQTVLVDPGSIYMIDGDTAEILGERYRLTGYDTPETYRASCAEEKALGNRATARARELIAEAAEVEIRASWETDKFGRYLAELSIPEGDLGAILISEGLAVPYHGGKRTDWCARL